MNPVELIKTNRDLMGKCILCLDGKWAGDGTGKISWILVYTISN